MNPSDDPALPAKKKSGCGRAVGCGCAVMAAALLAGGVLVWRSADRLIGRLSAAYTADAPLALPAVDASPQETEALAARVNAFTQALKAGTGGGELALTARDLNVLIQKNPAWSALAGRVFLRFEGERIHSDVSLPLGDLNRRLKGRWLNGSGTFRVETAAGRLLVFTDSLSVRGKPLPEAVMAGLRSKNLAEEAAKNPDTAALLRQLDSISMRDGTLVLRAR